MPPALLHVSDAERRTSRPESVRSDTWEPADATLRHDPDPVQHHSDPHDSEFMGNIGKQSNRLGDFSVNEAIRCIFMNHCMWAAIWLSEEGENVKIILVNHQNHKTRTIIQTAQARLRDLRDVAGEFYGISLWQNWKTKSRTSLGLLEPPTGSLLSTDVHVFSDSVIVRGRSQRRCQRSVGEQDL